jgi:hypothetical protein
MRRTRLHERYERIEAVYTAALAGRDPATVDIFDLLPAIYAALPDTYDDEVIEALRWSAEKKFREAEELRRYGERRAMTKRERIVRAGYVDEAVVEKLMESFGSKMNECLPAGHEIMTAAYRILIVGLHAHLTDGDPSATTPEIQARVEKFGDRLRELIQAAERGDVAAEKTTLEDTP